MAAHAQPTNGIRSKSPQQQTNNKKQKQHSAYLTPPPPSPSMRHYSLFYSALPNVPHFVANSNHYPYLYSYLLLSPFPSSLLFFLVPRILLSSRRAVFQRPRRISIFLCVLSFKQTAIFSPGLPPFSSPLSFSPFSLSNLSSPRLAHHRRTTSVQSYMFIYRALPPGLIPRLCNQPPIHAG